MRKLKVAELVLDYDLHPRTNLDSVNITNMCEALAVGIELPPVTIERGTKRVVDGFHRVKAKMRHDGPEAEINVIEKDYRSEADMFMDIARLNATHGLKLDPCDKVRCTIIAARLSISIVDLAKALNMTEAKLRELSNTRTAMSQDGSPLPLKNTVRKLFSGRRLTKRQEQANSRLSGMNQMFYANQLIELIESKMLDKENEDLMKQLHKLRGLLNKILRS